MAKKTIKTNLPKMKQEFQSLVWKNGQLEAELKTMRMTQNHLYTELASLKEINDLKRLIIKTNNLERKYASDISTINTKLTIITEKLRKALNETRQKRETNGAHRVQSIKETQESNSDLR